MKRTKDNQTLKQKKWVVETARTLNATEGAMRAYDVKNRNVAKVIGSENMAKPYLKEALMDVLEEQGLDNSKISALLFRNASQGKQISASNQALDIALKVKGAYAPVKSMSIVANLTPEDRRARLDEIMRQIALLHSDTPPSLDIGVGGKGEGEAEGEAL